jgi:hypothetical protein
MPSCDLLLASLLDFCKRSNVLCHLRQCRLGLGQPEGHVHGAVEGDGRGEFSTSLLWPSCLVVQGAKAEGELVTGVHGGQDDLTEALVPLHPLEDCHGLPKAVDGPPIVALGLVGEAEALVCPRV